MTIKVSAAKEDSDWRPGLPAHQALKIILGSLGAGFAAIPIFGFQAETWNAWASIIAFGAATAGASIFVGGLVGFLFGIPRRLQQQEDPKPDQRQAEQSGEATAKAAVYGANTNLEQISDWLTKILVGVGLTNLSGIAGLLSTAGIVAKPGFGGFPSSDAFAIINVIYFSVGGFLLGYLATRLYLGQALTAAERTYSLQRQLSKLEQQSQADALVLQLASAQLSGPDKDKPPLEELDAAIQNASRETKAQIFFRAQVQRVSNWKEEATKQRLERAVPIFRALAASDTRDVFHTNYAELGFALKDQPKPDWSGAERALSRAIAIRNKVGESDTSYEMNRAICRIMQDEAFAQSVPSNDETRERIVADLKVAAEGKKTSVWGKNEAVVKKWLNLNNLDFGDVGWSRATALSAKRTARVRQTHSKSAIAPRHR